MNYTMTALTGGSLNGLRKGQLLAVAGRRGVRVESRRGAVWITQDGDPNDVILNAGESHVLDGGAPVLIQALDPACVSVQPLSDRPSTAAARWWLRLRSALGLLPALRPAA
jgi:hypothetical protein